MLDIQGLREAQGRYDDREPEDDGELLCTCGHESNLHNGGDECLGENCTCKALSYPERDYEQEDD